MSRIYFYKLTVDDGGAPCAERGLLSLAICKPMIRRTAQTGDLIFGFAANSLHEDNRLIYVAEISERVEDGRYYESARFKGRSDRIYERVGAAFHIRIPPQFHTEKHLVHDLGKAPAYDRATVLISTEFRYFGGSFPEDYKAAFPAISRAVGSLGQGHRVNIAPTLEGELLKYRETLWQRYRGQLIVGKPNTPPRVGISHRGGGCGIIEKSGRAHP